MFEQRELVTCEAVELLQMSLTLLLQHTLGLGFVGCVQIHSKELCLSSNWFKLDFFFGGEVTALIGDNVSGR